MKLKGIYIDDDPANIDMYSTMLEDSEIEFIRVDLFDTPSEYYDFICQNEVDFVIIDRHLDKDGAKYDGFNVLEDIRKQDPYIHILLLTNDTIAHSSIYSDFDQTVKKGDLFEERENIISRIKRSHLLKRSIENTEHVKAALKAQKENTDIEIKKLEEIHATIKSLLPRE
ncbi:response regulator [Paenibacillus agaridevorans]|uniref:response regulator n=1 Tax=Paenibacillus agaridevorans TaxID=171404 RepID=UPI001BE4D3C5|nr:response regulator [Paenibacillus agaridevorans]